MTIDLQAKQGNGRRTVVIGILVLLIAMVLIYAVRHGISFDLGRFCSS